MVKHSGADRARCCIGYGRDELSSRSPTTAPGLPAMAGARGRTPRPHGTAARDRPSAGRGHGIIGMRERVSLCGGEFSAGPLPGRGFLVSARFPLPRGAQ